LDPDPYHYPDPCSDSLEMVDPDPDSMNPDPQLPASKEYYQIEKTGP